MDAPLGVSSATDGCGVVWLLCFFMRLLRASCILCVASTSCVVELLEARVLILCVRE